LLRFSNLRVQQHHFVCRVIRDVLHPGYGFTESIKQATSVFFTRFAKDKMLLAYEQLQECHTQS
jgi:hypothetical protein